MSQELVYTSAPRGLKPGSRGFCTVASTAGMAKNLAERLESLSGYRHIFAPNDPNAGLNPVVYSHLRIVVGGRPYHVLSRIGAAGLDYTQRSNKIAHHVALDIHELVPAGPAALLASSEFMESTWEGEPKVLATGRRPPSVNSASGICQSWQRLTGDAGWAGRLAEAATSNPRRNVTVVFKPGMDVLPLVAESLGLLPPPIRWQVTFSTYYTKLPPGIDCLWRFVLAGSPEAKAMGRSPQAEFIDLCERLSRAPDGALIEAARTGEPALLEVTNPWQAGPSRGNPRTDHVASTVEMSGSVSDEPLTGDFPLELAQTLEVPAVPPNARRFHRVERKALRWRPFVTAAVVASMLIGSALYGLFFYVSKVAISSTPLREQEKSANIGQVAETNTTEESKADTAGQAESATSETPTANVIGATPDATIGGSTTATGGVETSNLPSNQSNSDEQTAVSEKQAEPEKLVQENGVVETPLQPEAVRHADIGFPKSVSTLGPKPEPEQIAEVLHDKPVIELLGGKLVLDESDTRIAVAEHPSDDPNVRTFSIQLIKKGSELSKASTEIGELTLHGASLGFAWTGNAAQQTWRQKAVQLRNCALRLRASEESTVVQLRSPTETSSRILLGSEPSLISTEVDPWPRYELFLDVALPEVSLPLQTMRRGNRQITINSVDSGIRTFSVTLATENKKLELKWESDWKFGNSLDADPGSLMSRVNRELPRVDRDLERIRNEVDRLGKPNAPEDMAKLAELSKRQADLDSERKRLADFKDLLTSLEGTQLRASVRAELEETVIEVATVMLTLTSYDTQAGHP